MAINPFLAQALISGGKAILGHGLSKAFGGSRTKFKNTGWGKYLKQISEKGMYTPGMQANILGKVGTQVGQTTSDALSRYKGNLIKSGMENSIAGARGIKSTALSGQQQLVDTAKDVSHQNELSKIQAKSQYLQGVMQDQGMRENEEIGARNKLVGGLVDAGTGYFSDKLGHKMKLDAEKLELIKAGYDPQAITTPVSPGSKETGPIEGWRKDPYREPTFEEKEKIKADILIKLKGMTKEEKQQIIPIFQQLYPWL
tara:strand:+ start:11377 stop:12144 length:768 start_codon:yes stop_codon:yes gene_type:complete